MPNQYSHPWSEEELKWLKEEYPYLSKAEVEQWAKTHGRSYRAVINQASALSVRKKKKEEILAKRKDISKKIERAKKFEPLNRNFIIKRGQRVIILGDNHIPFNNSKAENEVLNFIKEIKPQIIVHAGDLLDFHQISHFRRIPAKLPDFVEDLETAKSFLAKLRKLAPKSQIFYIEGNHEFRLKKYIIDSCFVFYNLPSFSLVDLLGLKKLKIKYIALPPTANQFSHNYIKINDVYIGHFDKSLQNSGYTARWLRDMLGQNIITGHTHRLGLSYHTYLNEVKFGAEIGCLCLLSSSYLQTPDWQNGFAIIIFHPSGRKEVHLYNLY